MADEDFLIAVKHRLGLHPMEGLPAKCECGTQLSEDPQHFYSCSKRRAKNARHDAIVRLLFKAFSQVGTTFRLEPRMYATERVRPDLDVILPGQHVMFDVAVTHPGAPCRKSDKPCAAANDMQATKNRKYKDWALALGAKFLPFVLETHGALGQQAEDVLKLLTKAASASSHLPMPVRDFMKYTRQALSISLQRGNALVAKMGAIDARTAAAAAVRASLR